jgi:hypothetical protein
MQEKQHHVESDRYYCVVLLTLKVYHINSQQAVRDAVFCVRRSQQEHIAGGWMDVIKLI